jgi:hypothetical protein
MFLSKIGHLTEKVFDKRQNNLDLSLELEKLFSFLNLYPTWIEFDCPDVFVAAKRHASDENIKFCLIFQIITICNFNHMLYTIME